MIKKVVFGLSISLLISLLGCNAISQEHVNAHFASQVEEIVVQDANEKEHIIANEDQIKQVVSIVNEVEWEEGVIVDYAVPESVSIEMRGKEMKQKDQAVYYIWYNQGGKADFKRFPSAGWGRLNVEETAKLKLILNVNE
ncbi:hypothetical protein IC619_012325 [Hazenella sp. IB182353]|uniref:hypothetical protein n=1 Tax=Polycladospora coralii TaxID=2771432 RepID=UPI001746223D|nr:hypothetical protein [Polycladospora coralii]MBS7531278.1 hypothetical protein [Polycladospora coralii]